MTKKKGEDFSFDALVAVKTKEEAATKLHNYIDFIQKSNEDMPLERATFIARSNIGYVSGYYDDETMKRIQELYEIPHPIFGFKIPTPKEAFDAGVKWGNESKHMDKL
jgi:hypothetical protein